MAVFSLCSFGVASLNFFAVAAFSFFKEHFQREIYQEASAQSWEYTCDSIPDCFIGLFLQLLGNGDGSLCILMPISKNNPKYYWRVAFDVSLRFFTTMLSFSVIGSTVYGGLSDCVSVGKNQETKTISPCFICGLEKASYGKTEFKHHINQEHSIWRYVDCINMILNKKLEDDIY